MGGVTAFLNVGLAEIVLTLLLAALICARWRRWLA
jgi:hypothetical protein